MKSRFHKHSKQSLDTLLNRTSAAWRKRTVFAFRKVAGKRSVRAAKKKERGKHFLEGFLRRRGKSPSFQAHNVPSFAGAMILSLRWSRGMEAKKTLQFSVWMLNLSGIVYTKPPSGERWSTYQERPRSYSAEIPARIVRLFSVYKSRTRKSGSNRAERLN